MTNKQPQQRFELTEDEGIALMEINNSFYEQLSELVARHLARCPHPELVELLTMQLSESSSVYGCKYEEYLKRTPNGINWLGHAHIISVLDQVPNWQLQIIKTTVAALGHNEFCEWLQAFSELDQLTRLHLGYALRHRGATSAAVLTQQHGHKEPLRKYLALCEKLKVQLPEGF